MVIHSFYIMHLKKTFKKVAYKNVPPILAKTLCIKSSRYFPRSVEIVGSEGHKKKRVRTILLNQKPSSCAEKIPQEKADRV